jgi:hypothetical protein
VIVTRELPADALPWKDRERGAYTDCYTTDVPLQVSHARYVEAFYTSWAFKLERLLGFHKPYSRVLLGAAAAKITRSG